MYLLVQVSSQRLAQSNGRGGLALTQGGRGDTSHHNVVTVLGVLQAVADLQLDLPKEWRRM